MATAAARTRHRVSPGAAVVLWLAAAYLATWQDVGYVQAAPWGRPRTTSIPMKVRERRSEKGAPSRGRTASGKDSEARKLTGRMKGAKSAEEFVKILNTAVDGPIFNYFHASCAYHQLAIWKRSRRLTKAANSLKLPKLNGRVKEMIEKGQLNAQALANVLWSFDYLFDECPDVLDLVPAVAAQVPDKVKDMIPQGLSNVLWAAANLKDDAPDVLTVVDAITPQVSEKAKDMIPQHLSNVLWAAAKLKDYAPDVLNVVPAVAAQVPHKVKDMNPQELSNSLLSLVVLQDSAPSVGSFLLGETGSNTGLLGEAASRLVKLLPKLSGLDLFLTPPTVVWACAKMEQCHDKLLSAVAKRFSSRKMISSLRDWGLCALYGSYQLLDSANHFTDFAEMLKKELTRRGLSDSDVGWSLEGPLDWAWTDK